MGLKSWLQRRLGEAPAPPPRVAELALRLADVEAAVDGLNDRLTDALRSVNARITNAMKSANADGNPPQSLEDAPGSTIAPRPHVGYGHGQLPERRVRKNY